MKYNYFFDFSSDNICSTILKDVLIGLCILNITELSPLVFANVPSGSQIDTFIDDNNVGRVTVNTMSSSVVKK